MELVYPKVFLRVRGIIGLLLKAIEKWMILKIIITENVSHKSEYSQQYVMIGSETTKYSFITASIYE